MNPAQKQIKIWREDPVQFVRDVFNVEPDDWQKKVLREFAISNRIAMKSSKGVGKSALLAWCAWNFLVTRPHPKMVATSISGENLADGLWSELSKWQQKSELLIRTFTWTKTRIFANDHPETWFLSARTWAKNADSSQQADTLAGIHADYVLFILDECGGIPDGVMAAAEAGLSTGGDTKILMAGNPTALEGPLYRACTTERHLWKVTEITSDPDDPNRSPRVSKEWARQQIEKYGADSPWVLVNIFGRFPPSSINSLLGPDEVSSAMQRRPKEEDYLYSQKRIGVDVARFGQDLTCLFPRQGLMAFPPVLMSGARSNEIAARISMAKAKWSSEIEFIDDSGGYGAGVIDSLIQAGHSPVGVNFSGKATDPRYFNKRSEMWFRMAEWVKRGGCLPPIPELQRELTTPTYTFHNGKLRLEEKDQIKERLGFSPDRSDALCLTFSLDEMPTNNAHIHPSFASIPKHQADYDPFQTN